MFTINLSVFVVCKINVAENRCEACSIRHMRVYIHAHVPNRMIALLPALTLVFAAKKTRAVVSST